MVMVMDSKLWLILMQFSLNINKVPKKKRSKLGKKNGRIELSDFKMI